MSLKTIETADSNQRIILFGVAVLCFLLAILFVKWTLGHTISLRAQQKEVAILSTDLAPDDPQTHFSSAVLHEQSFLPEDFEKSVQEYEKAAALSPNNYLLWLALGKAREKQGDAAGAEKALRRAVELAPAYVDTHWTLGNNLLRQGRAEEAFREIRLAADESEKYVVPAITTAWQVYDGDIALVRNSIGNSPKLNANLSVFLISRERFDEAFETWNALPAEAKSVTYKPQSEEIYNKLIGAGKFRYGKLVRAAIDGADAASAFGKFVNGGFEENLKKEKPDFFEWQIGSSPQPLIGFDDKIKHGGNLSLVIIFNSANGQDFRPLSQTIAVEAGKQYRFETFYKSELKTTATLRWEIVNASDNAVIASTSAINASSDWTSLDAAFTAPMSAEAVIIRLARVQCGSTMCPITGKVWFDDFSLN